MLRDSKASVSAGLPDPSAEAQQAMVLRFFSRLEHGSAPRRRCSRLCWSSTPGTSSSVEERQSAIEGRPLAHDLTLLEATPSAWRPSCSPIDDDEWDRQPYQHAVRENCSRVRT